MSAYPGTIEAFQALNGTSKLSSPDHTVEHTLERSNIVAIETVLGTNSGTAVLKDFVAGDFAAKKTNGTIDGAVHTIGTYSGTASGTVTLDLSKSLHIVNLPNTGSLSINATGGTAGKVFMVDFVQGTTGNGTPALFTTIQAPGGSLSFGTAANNIDTIGFVQINAGTFRAYTVGTALS